MNGVRVRKWNGLIIIPLFLLLVSFLATPLEVMAEPPKSSDPSKHPVYSTYKFNKDGKHIYFGTIPLGAEGVIAEAMNHDSILRKNLKKMGLDVIFYPYNKGADVTFFTKRGDIDMGTAGAGPTMTLAAAADVEITGMTKVSSASLVARKGVLAVKDLKGLRIGYPEGGNAQLGLLTALSIAGLKETDVKLIPMDVGDVTAALADKKVDAFSAFEPTPTGALAKHKDFVQVHKFFLPGYLLQARTFAAKYPEASMELHASFVRSMRWLKKSDKNITAAAEWALKSFEGLTGKKSEVTVAQLKDVTKNEVVRFPNLPVISEADFKRDNFLHKSFELQKSQGKLPADSSWEKVEKSISKQSLKSILADPKKYQLDLYKPE